MLELQVKADGEGVAAVDALLELELELNKFDMDKIVEAAVELVVVLELKVDAEGMRATELP